MTFLSLSSSLRDNVDLPAPEGEERTSIRPRRATFSPFSRLAIAWLLQILHLLAELLDYAFKFKTDVRELEIIGLGGQRI